MSDLFENLSNASNGKELVDLINSLGLDAIAAELSGAEAAAIVEKFSADPILTSLSVKSLQTPPRYRQLLCPRPRRCPYLTMPLISAAW